MITIRLLGGLGNQLFQLAGMLYLQSLGRSVRCETSWYGRDPSGGETPRDLEIGALLGAAEQYRLPQNVARFVYCPRNPRLFQEQGPSDDLIGRLPERTAWAEGYYQRSKYPTLMRAELRHRLLPLLSGPSGARGIDAIGVHVRLGDYVTSRSTKAHHAVTDSDYFVEAIKLAREQIGDLPLRVFTDSPEMIAAGYLRSLSDSVEVSQATASWDALRELSSCAAIVMSNSSFSWWSAFIAGPMQEREVPVVMPRPWFAMPGAADELLRIDGWTQIQRSMDAS